MRGLTTWMKALAVAAAAVLASAAQAAPGNGIRLGGSDAHVHPFLDLEGRYDSNVAYTPANQAIGDVILHVRPGLEISAPGELAAFEFNGALDWAQYMGAEKDTTNLSKLYANATLAAAFNRNGAVSPRIDNTFARQISTTSLSAASTAVISNQNTLSLAVPWKPGGGALILAAKGQWTVETYEKYGSASAGSLADLGYNQYRGGAEVQWRFLPRTTGVLEGGYYARQPNGSAVPGKATGYDVMAGLTGLMTQRITATAKAGYGATAVSDVSRIGFVGGTTGSFLADLGAEWIPFDSLSLRLGYTRTLGLDPTVAAYSVDGVSGGFKVKLADRYVFRASARYDHFKFSSSSGSAFDGATSDFLRVDPALEAQFARWLNASLGYVYSSRASALTGVTLSPSSYAKNEVFLRVGLTY